jgi:hypothetical protein
MGAELVAAVKGQSEADYVEAQWEHLQKHKHEGITWEEYCKRRDINSRE